MHISVSEGTGMYNDRRCENYRYKLGLLRNNHFLAFCSWFAIPGTGMFPPTFLLDGATIQYSALEFRSLVDWLW